MRLIDADALKKDVGMLWEQMDDVDFGELVRDFWKMLNRYPTIDADPVVHARWSESFIGGYDGLHAVYYRTCSNCSSEELDLYYRYCPNCGAKMDGGAEE